MAWCQELGHEKIHSGRWLSPSCRELGWLVLPVRVLEGGPVRKGKPNGGAVLKRYFPPLLSIKFKCLFWALPEPSKVWVGEREPLAGFRDVGEVGQWPHFGHSACRGSASPYLPFWSFFVCSLTHPKPLTKHPVPPTYSH